MPNFRRLVDSIVAPFKNAAAQAIVEDRKRLFKIALDLSKDEWSGNRKQVAIIEYQKAMAMGLKPEEMDAVIERNKLPMYLR